MCFPGSTRPIPRHASERRNPVATVTAPGKLTVSSRIQNDDVWQPVRRNIRNLGPSSPVKTAACEASEPLPAVVGTEIIRAFCRSGLIIAGAFPENANSGCSSCAHRNFAPSNTAPPPTATIHSGTNSSIAAGIADRRRSGSPPANSITWWLSRLLIAPSLIERCRSASAAPVSDQYPRRVKTAQSVNASSAHAHFRRPEQAL